MGDAMNYAAVSILGLSLVGCAPRIPLFVVTPGAAAPSGPRPASEIVDEGVVTPRPGTGAILVTTERSRHFAEACTLDVALDGRLVAGLRPGEQVTLFAEPGRRIVMLSVRDEGSCRPSSRQVALKVIEHTTQAIVIGSDEDAALKVQVDPFGRSLPP
jgi:hypothetical protein